MDYQKKLLRDVKNVSSVAPGSKIPVVGSRLPILKNKQKQPSAIKRKADCAPEPVAKKQNKIDSGQHNTNRNNQRPAPKKALTNKLTNSKPPTASKAAKTSAVNNYSAKLPTKPVAKKPVAEVAVPGKKRQPWDLKGKLQDMEERHAALTNQIKFNREQLAAEKEALLSSHQKQVRDLEEKLIDSCRELEETRCSLRKKLEDLESAKMIVDNRNASLTSDLLVSNQECAALKTSVDKLTSAKAEVSSELMTTKMLLDEMVRENKKLKAMVAEQDQMILRQNEKLIKNESERRLLHNTIQELKGNIRVFCRVRPLIDGEIKDKNSEISHIEFPDKSGDAKMIELKKVGDVSSSENSVYEFQFDRVFSPKCTQEDVFEEISQLVQSSLDGYHVCIFAYGQTGSGKTYTMEGPENTDLDTEGMIPRAVNKVFASSAALKEKGWQYDLEVSFLEIYNETIRDLIGSKNDDTKHEIKMISANSLEVTVTNLTSVKVTEPAQVHTLLAKAGENRTVAETNCNLRSSRSHCVFQMKIMGHNTATDEKCIGLLNLIDLAGSERLKVSGSEKQRLKETQNINRSLSNLGNVIMALVNKDPHIPYRNSKLTHLLQHCLGGNSKVLMFVNVSPKEECFSETLNSLRFASMVNSCNIGTATKRVK